MRRFFCFIGNVLPYETECSAGKKYPLTGPESAPLLLEKRKKENKIMKKKVLAVILGAAMTVSLAACGSSGADSSGSGSGETSYTVGISQFAEHGSLDNCREGFIQGLAEEGIVEGENLTIEEGNAASDAGTARQISDGFVSDSVDLVCAIATPSAEAAYVSAMNTDIPVVYTAVTDPLAAKLADEDGTPVSWVSQYDKTVRDNIANYGLYDVTITPLDELGRNLQKRREFTSRISAKLDMQLFPWLSRGA